MKSYLKGVRDKKIRNGYITWEQGLSCDELYFSFTFPQRSPLVKSLCPPTKSPESDKSGMGIPHP